MSNKILNSILITIFLVLSVYFVSSLTFDSSFGEGTHYNITDSTGAVDTASVYWNAATNYTVHLNTSLAENVSVFFNFTINGSGTHTNAEGGNISGNLTNITISFGSEFMVDAIGTSNISMVSNETAGRADHCVFTATRRDGHTIEFSNHTCGIGNHTDGGWTVGYFVVNVSTNGTYGTLSETYSTIQINVTNSTTLGNATTGNQEFITIQVGVDSQAPRVTLVNATANSVTQLLTSGGAASRLNGIADSIDIYATITDINLNTSNVKLYYNVSGLAKMMPNNWNQTMTISAISGTPTNKWLANATLNTSFSDGATISFIIIGADKFNQSGNGTTSAMAGYNITIDETRPPQPEITIPGERNPNTDRVLARRSYEIYCDGDNGTLLQDTTDSIDICGSTDYAAISGSCHGNWDSLTPRTVTLKCTTWDDAGNSREITKDITVYKTGDDGELPTGDDGGRRSIDVRTPANTTLSVKETQTFSYGVKEHTLTIDSISEDSVTITIRSDPVTITIGTKQSKEVDIDGDGNNDIKVTLNAIRLGKADITIEKLATATPEYEEVTEKKGLAWLWWLLGIIVIGVVIYLIVMKQKNK